MHDVAVSVQVVDAKERQQNCHHDVRARWRVHRQHAEDDHEQHDDQRTERGQEVREQPHRLAGKPRLDSRVRRNTIPEINQEHEEDPRGPENHLRLGSCKLPRTEDDDEVDGKANEETHSVGEDRLQNVSDSAFLLPVRTARRQSCRGFVVVVFTQYSLLGLNSPTTRGVLFIVTNTAMSSS